MKTISKWLFIAIIACTITACGGDDNPIQPIAVNFENIEVGIRNGEAIVTTILSRAASADGEVSVSVDDAGLTYGEDNDYYTDPAIANNVLTLPFISGDAEISFTVYQGAALNIAEDTKITLTAIAPSDLFEVGKNSSVSIVFSENFVMPSATISATVGAAREKEVYIDLSTGETTAVVKDNYDLALESSGNGFNILLNKSSKMMALNTDKTSFSEVSADDLEGVEWQGNLHLDLASGEAISLGNFSETRFYQWDADGATSKVFIINRGEKDKSGTDRGIKKVQITKSSDSYIVKSADLDGSNENDHTITKSADYTFKFVHFENGEADVEPRSWDISIRTAGQAAAQGGVYHATYNTLGAFQNHYGGIKVATIADKAFNDIAKSDAESAISNSNSDLSTVAFGWRSLNFSTFQYEVTDELTYIIFDIDDNYFKLKFTNYYGATSEEEPQLYYEHLR